MSNLCCSMGKVKKKLFEGASTVANNYTTKKIQSRKSRENKIDNKAIPKKAYTAAVKKDLVTITQLPFQIIF